MVWGVISCRYLWLSGCRSAAPCVCRPGACVCVNICVLHSGSMFPGSLRENVCVQCLCLGVTVGTMMVRTGAHDLPSRQCGQGRPSRGTPLAAPEGPCWRVSEESSVGAWALPAHPVWAFLGSSSPSPPKNSSLMLRWGRRASCCQVLGAHGGFSTLQPTGLLIHTGRGPCREQRADCSEGAGEGVLVLLMKRSLDPQLLFKSASPHPRDRCAHGRSRPRSGPP